MTKLRTLITMTGTHAEIYRVSALDPKSRVVIKDKIMANNWDSILLYLSVFMDLHLSEASINLLKTHYQGSTIDIQATGYTDQCPLLKTRHKAVQSEIEAFRE